MWGIGVEGCAAARYAMHSGAASIVGVVDAPLADLEAWERASHGAQVFAGLEGEDALRGADVVLRSPGISIHRPLVRDLRAKGTAVIGGTAIFLEQRGALTIAVTGSKGKSTTSALIAHLLTALGSHTIHAGNIGTPTLDLLLEPQPDYYVLEISSFQASDVTVSPRVVVLTSLFPDHLDWHGNESTYYDDKLRLADGAPAFVVANAADTEQRARLAGRSDVVWYSSPATWNAQGRNLRHADITHLTLPTTRLIGEHNAANVCAALTALEAVGVDVRACAAILQVAIDSFAPLAHRLELVASVDSVDYIDDSLSTSPHAAIAALQAFADRPVTLIAGGHDRGMSFGPLALHIAARSEWTAVVTLPANGPHLSATLEEMKAGITTIDVPDLDHAVRVAGQITPPGGIVLLSPAAPSFGQFTDYADRSNAFLAAIGRLEP